MKDNRLYLLHILECIERIEQYTIPGQTTFLSETMVQDAIYKPCPNQRNGYHHS